MFTGLVEEIGVVAELNPQDETGGTSLTIVLPETSKLLSDAQLGDSIAINGVCLTATNITQAPAPSFTVGIAPETQRLTNLGALPKDSRVNLERAVRADTRMGGHFVQGHVDSVAKITRVEQDGNAIQFRFAPESVETMRYIVHKGFIAIDGTSLTITKVNDVEGWFEIMLIAYSQEKVVLAGKKVGDGVNIEVDVLAKYAEKSMAGYIGSQGDALLKPFLEKMLQDLVAQAMGSHGSSSSSS